MKEVHEPRAVSLMTICRKAGKLVQGFDAVKEALLRKKADLVLLAADTSEKTEKEIRYYGGKTEILRLPVTKKMLAAWFRKETAVYGVCDPGFAKKFRELLADAEKG